MTNKYLEKASALIRSPENIGSRLAQLGMAGVNRLKRTKGIVLNNKGRPTYIPDSLPRGERDLPGKDKLKQTLSRLYSQPNAGSEKVEEIFRNKVGDKPSLFYR